MWRYVALVVMVAGCDHLLQLNDIKPHPDAMHLPKEVSEAHSHGPAVATLSFAADVPDLDHMFMIVSVMLAGSATTVPQVSSITYGGVQLAMLDVIAGVPDASTTRTEQWKLVAPPAGNAMVVITLSKPGLTIHGSAMMFSGIDQVNPVRDVEHTSGFGTTSMVTVNSEPNDLVESVVGNGGGIVGAGAGQDVTFLDDNSQSNTLDNAAGSTAPGIAPTMTMSWTYIDGDDFQEIAASLQPAS